MSGRATVALCAGCLTACTFFTPLGGISGGSSDLDAGDAQGPRRDARAGHDVATDGHRHDARVDGSVLMADAARPGGDASMPPPDASEPTTDAGGASLLASHQSQPTGIAVNSGYVYWVNAGSNSIYRVETSGGTPTRVDTPSDAVSGPFDVAVNGTTLYWTERANALIASRPLAGGVRTNLPTPQGAAALAFLALDGDTVYVSDYILATTVQGYLYDVTATDAGVFSVQPNTVSGVSVFAGTVLFAQATYGAILEATPPSSTSQYVGYSASDSGIPQPIAGIACDGQSVFFLQGQQSLQSVSLSGGSRKLIVELGSDVGVGDVAVDGEYVYWTEPSLGNLRRTAKPP
jgi:hypothetical protein